MESFHPHRERFSQRWENQLKCLRHSALACADDRRPPPLLRCRQPDVLDEWAECCGGALLLLVDDKRIAELGSLHD
jgi:hypothetical protein